MRATTTLFACTYLLLLSSCATVMVGRNENRELLNSRMISDQDINLPDTTQNLIKSKWKTDPNKGPILELNCLEQTLTHRQNVRMSENTYKISKSYKDKKRARRMIIGQLGGALAGFVYPYLTTNYSPNEAAVGIVLASPFLVGTIVDLLSPIVGSKQLQTNETNMGAITTSEKTTSPLILQELLIHPNGNSHNSITFDTDENGNVSIPLVEYPELTPPIEADEQDAWFSVQLSGYTNTTKIYGSPAIRNLLANAYVQSAKAAQNAGDTVDAYKRYNCAYTFGGKNIQKQIRGTMFFLKMRIPISSYEEAQTIFTIHDIDGTIARTYFAGRLDSLENIVIDFGICKIRQVVADGGYLLETPKLGRTALNYAYQPQNVTVTGSFFDGQAVRVLGEFSGTFTYETTMGGTKTVPQLKIYGMKPAF